MGRLQNLRVRLLHYLTNSTSCSNTHSHFPWNLAVRGLKSTPNPKRKLQCILTCDIDKLGKAGETVKVAPGYFRNYLMPKMLALPNIDKYAHLISQQLKIYQHPNEEKKEEAVQRTEGDQMDDYKTAVRRLYKGRLGLRRIVLNYGKELRYPVTKEEILNEVKRQLHVGLEPENLVMQTDLTMCGEYEIPLRLPKVIPLPDGKTNISLKVKIRRK